MESVVFIEELSDYRILKTRCASRSQWFVIQTDASQQNIVLTTSFPEVLSPNPFSIPETQVKGKGKGKAVPLQAWTGP